MEREVVALRNHLEQVNNVAVEYLKGSNVAEIAKSLGLNIGRVETLLNEWRMMAASNEAINRTAKEALAGAVAHYSSLIKSAYEVIDEASNNGNLTAKNTAIKIIGDLEAKRVDMLHKAGLLDNSEVMTELANMEKKHEVLLKILREVTLSCDHCKIEVMRRLASVNESAVASA